jgi:F-type H+-transporting ATPase subunit c
MVARLPGRMKKTRKTVNMTIPMLAEMSGSIHIGLAALGSAIGVGFIGMKAAEATGRNPGAAGQIRNIAIILAALAEGITFFAIYLAH